MEVSVFVPAHITGFFSIHNDKNLLKKGSCGAGVLIDKGVITTIKTSKKENASENDKKNDKNDEKETPKKSLRILINGKKDPKNEMISIKTIEIMKKELKLEFDENIAIEHNIEVPIGSGFGTSASCALGTAIGISKILKLDISPIKAMQYAHLAEISLKSGLGDVLSQTSEGIVLREIPGAPGIGKTKKIAKTDYSDNYSDIYVLTRTFGEIDTSSVIEDPLKVENINKIGLIMQKRLIANPSLKNFIACSHEFAEKTGLMNKELKNIVNDLDEKSIGASMAMLGNTMFFLIKKENLSDIKNRDDYTISKIYNKGIKII